MTRNFEMFDITRTIYSSLFWLVITFLTILRIKKPLKTQNNQNGKKYSDNRLKIIHYVQT